MYDSDIRSFLYKDFTKEPMYINDSSTIIVPEMPILNGYVRIDVAVINGLLHGYEIKSDMDTLKRLPRQSEYYSKVFDEMILITTEKYINEVKSIVPPWWGIKFYNKNGELKNSRYGENNNNVDSYSRLTLLWKDELIELISRYTDKKYKSKTKLALIDIILKEVPKDVIMDYTREIIKLRVNWRAVSISQLCDE
ncbi:sce7726 family protein [Clostridium sp. PL3]|uniref:Sce7726 family protein n=1 Tax=Clostridium thailandense TaxID=2794346 RepID=A0A949TQ08_9CLOT|nr:sce7726 family protein [Clostridium thailandense]MBV7276834.1 sce7726 family protein [Clostridium thailandense]